MYNKAIDSYISYCFESHEVKTHKEYPNSIFWVKDGNIIVEIKNSKFFWLHLDIWDSISRMFELDYNGTQSVIKEWLKQHPNLGELTPTGWHGIGPRQLEQHHNLGGLTPHFFPILPVNMLEQHHNLGGLTPHFFPILPVNMLEQHHNLGGLTLDAAPARTVSRWNNTIIWGN